MNWNRPADPDAVTGALNKLVTWLVVLALAISVALLANQVSALKEEVMGRGEWCNGMHVVLLRNSLTHTHPGPGEPSDNVNLETGLPADQQPVWGDWNRKED